MVRKRLIVKKNYFKTKLDYLRKIKKRHIIYIKVGPITDATHHVRAGSVTVMSNTTKGYLKITSSHMIADLHPL